MFTQNKRQPTFVDTDLMPFGKYKGEPLEDVPASYLSWLRDELSPEYDKASAKNITQSWIMDKLKLYNYIHNSWDAIKLELNRKD